MIPTESLGFHPAYAAFLVLVPGSIFTGFRYGNRRALQVFSFGLFVCLFWLAAFEGRPEAPVDFFLFSNPLIALVHTLATRLILDVLWLSLVFVGLSMVLGRVFCSHVCPMGTFLDLNDRLIARPQGKKTNRNAFVKLRATKFIFLLAILGAASVGFNLLGFSDPIVLLTRFLALVFYPLNLVLQEVGLQALRPIGASLNWMDLAYYELILPSFEGALLMTLLLVGFLLLSRLQPRFWCRHLCPLGALLSWLGYFAPYRRRVSQKCNGCNICVRKCPMGAIHEEGKVTDRSECIVCLECVKVCPESAVSFRFTTRKTEQDQPGVSLGRRSFLGGATGGLIAAASLRGDILHPSYAFLPYPLRHERLIRPPGAVPEPEFLSRCIRCGLCMRACLSNTIQPDWHRAGFEGLWAPYLNLRFAACEQTCNVCGQVCPTQAIRPLDLMEKQYAKIGTAVVLRDRCLPWSQNRRCLICDEQCPYNAIFIQHDDQHDVPLPIVDANKCNGCGQCEDKCPVLGKSAILVTPQGELRLSKGSYRAEAKSLGLVFEAPDTIQDEFSPKNSQNGSPSGFHDTSESQPSAEKPELPPGILSD